MSSNDQQVHTADAGDIEWNFNPPPSNLRGQKLQLLTIGKVMVTGPWKGGIGEYFVAWAPLMKVPKVTNGYNRNGR